MISAETVNKTKAFQQENGLKVDRQVNPGGPTEKALQGRLNKSGEAPQTQPGQVSIERQVETLREMEAAKAARQRQQQAAIAKARQRTSYASAWQQELAKPATERRTPKAFAADYHKANGIASGYAPNAKQVASLIPPSTPNRQAETAKAPTPKTTQATAAARHANEFMGLGATGGPVTAQTPEKDLRQKMLDFRANMVGRVGNAPLGGSVGLNGKNLSSDVMKMQSKLAEKGLLDSRYISGYIGAATVEAIKDLQKQTGAPVTGTMTPEDVSAATAVEARDSSIQSGAQNSAFPSVPVDGEMFSPPTTSPQPKTFSQQAARVYRGVTPPELRQQIEGLSELAAQGVSLFSPGADIRDALLYSEQTTEDFLSGNYLDGLRNGVLTGVSLGGLALPGSVGGVVKPANDITKKGAGKYDPNDSKWGKGGGNLFGANGVKVDSHTIYDDTKNYKGYRIDIENSAPGRRAGQIHLQTPDKQKYVYNVNTGDWSMTDEANRLLTKKERKMLNRNEFKKALERSLRYMGEGE